MGGGSTCLSGRTMAYRTHLFRFDGFKNYFLNEHFAGQLQLSGDDKALTRLCIMSDYKMWHQICEVGENPPPPELLGLMLLTSVK